MGYTQSLVWTFYLSSQLKILLSIIFAKHCQVFTERILQTSGILQNNPYFECHFQNVSHLLPSYSTETSNNYK